MRALVIGSAGQDGSYLSEQLTARGWEVTGLDRETPHRLELTDRSEVVRWVRELAPDRLYYLAAYHHSSEDPARGLPDELQVAEAVHVRGWLHALEGLFLAKPDARAFFAASSHCFGEGVPGRLVNEQTPMAPRSAYAVTKASAVELGRLFRAQGRHVSAGFLFNHESERRQARFVSQRICRGAVEAARRHARAEPFTLELGSLSAVVDWGYAPDYTQAMSHITEFDTPGDYVIATGVAHTVADWCSLAFSAVGLDWQAFVRERGERVTRQVAPLIGDATLLRTRTGWAPQVSFEAMVGRMVEAAQKEVVT